MFVKRSLFIVSMLLMASVAMAENACIKDGYLIELLYPKEKCPGELVKIKKITKKLNQTICALKVVDWEGKAYVTGWSCIGSDVDALKKSLEKEYIGLPTKWGDTTYPSNWGRP